MKISIQGISGAFHEEAARLYYSDEISIVENLTFNDLIKSVESEKADAGIMAIENTISGTIHSNLELIKHASLIIVGEIYLRICQNLAVKSGVKIGELKQVESHYMAINQCRAFFRDYPEIRLVDMEDTALSMKNVSENNLLNTGAIGSKLAAEYYDLEIIGKGIETNKKNFTRFLILERSPLQIEKTNKASLQLILGAKKGALADVLNIICKHNIDLTKIESMPIIGEPWHYQFYLDVLYQNVSDYKRLLVDLESCIESFRVLGNYLNQNIKAKQ